MHRQKERFRSLLLLLLLCGWLVFNWIDTVRHLVEYYNPLPAGDYWRVVEDLSAFKNFDLSPLWRQHNEHRIVFPEVIFAIDMLCFEGRQLLPAILNFCFHFTTWLVLARVAWQERSVPPLTRIIAILLAGIAMGWSLNSFVTGLPFLLQWTLLQLAVILALVLLARVKGANNPIWLIGVIACGVVATFSSGNGMLLWPVLIGGSLLLRIERTPVILLAATAAASIGLFFAGYRSPGHLRLLALFEHPLQGIGFIVSFVSMPFGVLRSPVIGFVFGTVNIACWFMLAIYTARSRVLSSQARLIFFGWYTFALLSAALIAASRIDLQDTGFIAAKAGRYVTLPLISWAALIEAAILSSEIRERKAFQQRATIAIAAVVLAFMQVRLARWLRSNDQWMAARQLTRLSLENGLLDPALILNIFPDAAFVKHYLPELKLYRLSIYSGNSQEFPGKSVIPSCRIASGQHQGGEIREIIRVPSGFEITGLLKPGAGYRGHILFADESKRIIGFGRPVRASCFPQFFSRHERSTAWMGFINSSYGAHSFSAYLSNSQGAELVTIEIGHPLPERP